MVTKKTKKIVLFTVIAAVIAAGAWLFSSGKIAGLTSALGIPSTVSDATGSYELKDGKVYANGKPLYGDDAVSITKVNGVVTFTTKAGTSWNTKTYWS